MRKMAVAIATSASLLVAGIGLGAGAADAAPGKEIKSACGASFGQVVSSLQPGWEHPGDVTNAKGGAKAFAQTLAVHCPA